MTPQQQIADAIREITALVQKEIDAGRSSTRIDANDVIEILLAIAEKIDPDPPLLRQPNRLTDQPR